MVVDCHFLNYSDSLRELNNSLKIKPLGDFVQGKVQQAADVVVKKLPPSFRKRNWRGI